MKTAKKLVFLLSLYSSLLMIFAGVLLGDFSSYALGSFLILALIIYSLVSFSDKRLILLIIVVFLYLRYIPIAKFNQPLYGDAILDYKTAEVFKENASIEIIKGESGQWIINRMGKYSGWPLMHVNAIVISAVTGISLIDVFAYFPPLIALSSVLFVYLLATYIFKSQKIGVLSALFFTTFPITMHWQTLMVRENLAYILALMIIYLYSKGKANKETKIMALSLLLFGVLPIAHHLTAVDILYIFGFIFLLTFFLNLDFLRKNAVKILHPLTINSPNYQFLTVTLLFVVSVSIFAYWIAYPREIILSMFVSRGASILTTLTGMKEINPDLPRYVREIGRIDLYDILSFTRMLFLGIFTLYGVFLLFKERNPYKPILYGLLLAPSILVLAQIFILKGVEMRHVLFLLISVFLLSAKAINNFGKKVLVIGLLIILLPTPFKLDTFLIGSPTYIYDRNSSYDFPAGQKVPFRDHQALAAASFFEVHTNSSLKTDFYIATALVAFYDPYKLYSPFTSATDENILAIYSKYFDTHQRIRLPPDSSIIKYITEYAPANTSCIYNNGEVKVWKS